MRTVESIISLLGLAVTLLAWIIPQDRIGYEVKFTLLGIGLTIVVLGLGLLVKGWRRGRKKLKSIDQLSEFISTAIRDLVNKPRPPQAEMEVFATELKEQYDNWCIGVNQILSNKSYFTHSDFLHFDRLGFIPPIVMTRHPNADHTLAMLNVKIDRLREIISWNR